MKNIVCVQFNVKRKIIIDIICRSWIFHSRLWYWPPACTPKDEVETGGGVEDTRLEAKAMDTKKIPGQGQGQTPSRPRPRIKDKDASVLQKKGLQKFFSGDLKKKGLPKKFLGEKGLQNFFSGDLYLRKPKKRSLQIFCKVSGVFQRNFNGSKIVLSSS